jgi:hypothetical protein
MSWWDVSWTFYWETFTIIDISWDNQVLGNGLSNDTESHSCQWISV